MVDFVPPLNSKEHIEKRGVSQKNEPPKTTSFKRPVSPKFQAILERWFPGYVTPEIARAFEDQILQCINLSIQRSKKQYERNLQERKERQRS